MDVTPMAPSPEVIFESRSDAEKRAWVRCPYCGAIGSVDEGQFEGRVSIHCTKCGYHETHDLSD